MNSRHRAFHNESGAFGRSALSTQGGGWHGDYQVVRTMAERAPLQAPSQCGFDFEFTKQNTAAADVETVASNCHLLGSELISVSDECYYEDGGSQMSKIGSDLVTLSFTICRVHKHMKEDPENHTPAFVKDLNGFVAELDRNRIDVAECCIQVLDTAHPFNTITGGSLSRLALIAEFVRQLHVLRKKLISMNYVLLNSIEEAKGSNIPMLSQDRNLYESILARTPGATLDYFSLRRVNLEFIRIKTYDREHGFSTPHVAGPTKTDASASHSSLQAAGSGTEGPGSGKPVKPEPGSSKFTERTSHDFTDDEVTPENSLFTKEAAQDEQEKPTGVRAGVKGTIKKVLRKLALKKRNVMTWGRKK